MKATHGLVKTCSNAEPRPTAAVNRRSTTFHTLLIVNFIAHGVRNETLLYNKYTFKGVIITINCGLWGPKAFYPMGNTLNAGGA
jgi:hypothetical protein